MMLQGLGLSEIFRQCLMGFRLLKSDILSYAYKKFHAKTAKFNLNPLRSLRDSGTLN